MLQVRYLIALQKALDFTRAAEQHHQTHPAMTRAIRAPEGKSWGE